MKRRVVPGTIVAMLLGCGDDGAENRLTISRAPAETTITITSRLRGERPVSLAAGETQVALMWIEGGADQSRVAAQVFDGDLQKNGDVVELSEDLAVRRDHTSLCKTARGWNAVWSDNVLLDRITGSGTLDISNVQARWAWPRADGDVVQVNANVIGSQTSPEVACLSDGRRAVTWTNICIAARRTSGAIFYFVPDECETEPNDGSYLQIVSPGGNAEGDVVELPAGAAVRVPTAAFGADAFILFAGSAIQVRANDGELLDEHVDSEVDFSDAVVACNAMRCAAATIQSDLRIHFVDRRSVGSMSSVVAAAQIHPGTDRTIRPFDPNVACDSERTCIVSWVVLSETRHGDYATFEVEGVFARAFDLESGELGPEAMIASPDMIEGDERGVLLAATGRRTFAMATVGDADIKLGALIVD